MTLEKRIDKQTTSNILNGVARTLLGVGLIAYSVMDVTNSHKPSNVRYETLVERAERNKLSGKYNNTPKETLEFRQTIGDGFVDSVPYIIMIGGVLSVVSGASRISNRTYRTY